MFKKNILSGLAISLLTASSAMAATSAMAGPYVGVQLGLAQPTMTVEDSDCWWNCSAYTQSKTSVVPGIQGGYYWASGSFLAGVSAEYSFGSVKSTFGYSTNNDGSTDIEANAKYKGVASLRGRLGLVVDNTAVVVSAGPASGRFDSRLKETNGTATATDDYESSRSGSVNGMVTGVSIEHALNAHLMIALEASQYSFKHDESRWAPSAGNSNTFTSINKSNHIYKLQTANLSLNWRF